MTRVINAQQLYLSITLVGDLIPHGKSIWVTQAGYDSLFTYMTYVFRWWCARFFGLWKFVIWFECLFIYKLMNRRFLFFVSKIDFNLLAEIVLVKSCVGKKWKIVIWVTHLSYGWTLRTKFLECFPGTSVCGPYFWAPLPCWALATHNDMIHMITNDIIIKAKINAPKYIFKHVSRFENIKNNLLSNNL